MTEPEFDSPPILAKMDEVEIEDDDDKAQDLTAMPSLEKVSEDEPILDESAVPFRQYTSESKSAKQIQKVIEIVPDALPSAKKPKQIPKLIEIIPDSPPATADNLNSQVPFARDTSLSILKLAYKLKQAQKKLEKKKSISNGSLLNKGLVRNIKVSPVKSNGDVKTSLKSVITQKGNVFVVTHPPNITQNIKKISENARPAQVSLLKPIPRKYFQISPDAKNAPGASTESPIITGIVKPIQMPKRPTEALQLLTAVKLKVSDEKELKLPESTGLPLWPIFSATRDGASKMDMSFLDKYIPANNNEEPPEPINKSTRSGRQIVEPDRLVASMDELEVDTSVGAKFVNGAEKSSDEPEKILVVDVPRNVTKENYEAIEDLAFDMISRQHLPRAAKKAMDITKAVIGTTRRSVFQSTAALVQTPKSSFTAVQTTTVSNSPAEKNNPPSSILLQKLTNQPSPSSGTNSPSLPATVTKQELANAWRVGGAPQVNGQGAPVTVIQPGGVIPRKYRCPSCKYQTDNRSHLRRHESSVHSGEKIYECYICKIDFARSEKCRSHMLKQHPEIQYDPRLIRKDKTYCNKPVNYTSDAFKEQLISKSLEQNGGLDLSMKTLTTPIRIEPELELDAERNVNAFTADSFNNSLGAEDEISFDLGTPKQSDGEDSLLANGPSPSKLSRPSPIHGTPAKLTGASPQTSTPAPPRYQCPQCSYAGKDAWHVKRHIQDVHNNRKAYQCKMCSYVTSRKHRLISHMKGHGTLSCLYCDYATPDYDIFQSHLKLCAEAQKLGGLTCRICNHAFHNRKILAEHMERLHETVLYMCDMCYFSSTDKEEFHIHSDRHLKVENDSKSSLVNSLRTCSQCGEAFKTEKKYEQHMMNTHKTSEVDFDIDGTFLEERDGMYVCLLCSFETVEKGTITAHIEHHKSKWFRCDVPDCSFVAATKKALSKHKVNSHLDLLQNASYTKAAPVDGAHLYDNETGGLQGHGSGMWQCHICPDKTLYRYRRSYEKHMAKHKGFVEPSIEVQSHRIMPSFDPNALTCLMCGAQGWNDRAQLQAHLLHAHGIDAFDHRDEDSSGSISDHAQTSASSSSASLMSAAHPPRMSDAHMQMLRQIAVNATSPVHVSASGPIAWPEPEEQSAGADTNWPESEADSRSDSERTQTTATTKNGNSSSKSYLVKSPPVSRMDTPTDMTSQAEMMSLQSRDKQGTMTSSKRAPSEITRVTSQQFDSSDSEDEAWPSEWTSAAPKRLKTT